MRILFVVDIATYLGLKPIGIMYISSSLKTGGHEVRVIDISNKNIEKTVKDYNPHFFAYSVCSGSEPKYLKMNRRLRKLSENAVSIFGGPHPTFFPDFINEDGVDVICRGEGEEAFTELADRAERKQTWCDVKNLWIKDGQAIIKNPCRPLRDNLDQLPLPDRELFKDVSEAITYIEYAIISRGCPYDCSYCFNHQLRGLYGLQKIEIRTRSVDNVISELKNIKELNKTVQYIQFMEDIFPFERDWVDDFKSKYMRYINLPFSINCRANLVYEENIKALKEAGCRVVSMAVESGDDFVRNEIFKRNLSRDSMLKAARIIKKYSLFLQTTNILGNPIDTPLDEAYETIRLNIEMRPDFANGSLLNPYFGTKIWDYCLKGGYIDNTARFSLTYHMDSPLKINDKKKILNLFELFPIIVNFPILFRCRYILAAINLRPFYALLRKLLKSYRYYFGFYRIRFSLRDMVSITVKYLPGKENF